MKQVSITGEFMPRKRTRNIPGMLSLIFLAAMTCFLHISAGQTSAQEEAPYSGEETDPDIPGYGPAEKNPDPDEMAKSIERMESRALELQEKIAAMRDRAFDNNPELDLLLKELVVKTHAIMTENLQREEVDLERLQHIEEKLQDPEISSERRDQLKQEKEKAFLGYKKAEMRTENNETLRELREEFYEELLDAAKKENPDAEKLLNELDILQHQLRFIKPAAMPEKQPARP